MTELKALGSSKTEYGYTHPDPSLLEKFLNPSHGKQSKGALKIDIETSEFTSLCPKTGQPDYATIVISYIPDEFCVESKSLKLYLMGFRMHGEFHEGCVDRIGNDLVKLLEPLSLTVLGRFTPRGGIKFWPMFGYEKPRRLVGG